MYSLLTFPMPNTEIVLTNNGDVCWKNAHIEMTGHHIYPGT